MEGPSLVITSEERQKFVGKSLQDVVGNTTVDKERLCGEKVYDICSFGKQLILEFDSFVVRVHFLMYGSYRVDSRKDLALRLGLVFPNGEVNFYNCSVKILSCSEAKKMYDWRIDIMSPEWNKKIVLKKLQTVNPDAQVGDILLDQTIFAGVGNIIKNEVLFNVKIKPETLWKGLSAKQVDRLVEETRKYSLQAYRWKKAFEWKKHWQVFRKTTCPNGSPVMRKKTGVLNRWSYWCDECAYSASEANS